VIGNGRIQTGGPHLKWAFPKKKPKTPTMATAPAVRPVEIDPFNMTGAG